MNLLMLNFESSPSNPLEHKLKIRAGHAALSIFWAMTAFLAFLASASAQDFTLQAAPFSPDAVAPGGTSASNITVGVTGSFTGSVDLTCQVSSMQTTTSPPACAVSPATVTPPANAAATITTTDETSTVGYNIAITGTASATPTDTHTTTPLQLTVLAVTAQFTISVQRPVQPSSVPAGSGGQAVIVINPSNGYVSPGYPTKGIILSCSSITPLVVIPPVCSFSYPAGVAGVPVNGVPATSTLTISTYGPQITSSVVHPRTFYAPWMPVPMLALVGLGAVAGGKRSRKACGLLALFVITAALFLMPACGNTTTQVTTLNGVTPANSYSITVSGVDADGVVSSNSSSTTSANPTVSLTVTAPTI